MQKEVDRHAVDGLVLTFDKPFYFLSQTACAADVFAHGLLRQVMNMCGVDSVFFAQKFHFFDRRLSGVYKPLGQFMLRPDDQFAVCKFAVRSEVAVSVGEQVDVIERDFAYRQFGYQLFGIIEINAVAEKQLCDSVGIGGTASARINFKAEDCRFHHQKFLELQNTKSPLLPVSMIFPRKKLK